MALMSARAQWGKLEITQQALSHAQKQDALGKLVAGVAHDFNNILAVTLGNAELLRDAPADQKDAFADEIIKAADRGAALSGQLLAFGRRTHLKTAAQPVSEILHDLERMLQRVLPGNIEVTTAIHPNTPAVLADRHQLETALLNLAINARDAMPNGGELEVSAERFFLSEDESIALGEQIAPGAYTRFMVRDTGTGVSKEMSAEVFDPFFTTKPAGEGTGLGLSMVLGFAQQSGGTVLFDSALGRGTTVTVILPSSHTPLAPTSAPDALDNYVGAARVLVVEDDPAVRQVVERQIQSGGYTVSTAATGQDALQMLEAGFRPNLLVTDLVMPGPVQGVQLAKAARHMNAELRVVFLSGYPNDATPEITEWSSEALILEKPIRREALLIAVRNALSSAT